MEYDAEHVNRSGEDSTHQLGVSLMHTTRNVTSTSLAARAGLVHLGQAV